mmetsp:Transcript_52302/g.59780  ORF Transcript_52302/g.59780 Transcript_52302/m.59780 type:complete len:224 (+) Transcript_52302:286-957(+)
MRKADHGSNAHAAPLSVQVVILGEGRVGKTSMIHRYIDGIFDPDEISSKKANCFDQTIKVGGSRIRLNIWDTAGQEKLCGLRDGYYIEGQCAIVMFDVSSRVTYKNVPKWYKDLTRVCENIPIVMVGNKVDIKDRKVKAKQITFHRKRNLQFYEVSAKSNYQFEKPFVWILRRLTGDPNLTLVESVGLRPAEVKIDEARLKEMEEDLIRAQNIPLPEDDDEDL